MKITVKKQIYLEHERTVTIRWASPSAERFCNFCGEWVKFITVENAAIIRQTTVQKILKMAEGNLLHFDETADQRTLICFSSIAKNTAENFLPPIDR